MATYEGRNAVYMDREEGYFGTHSELKGLAAAGVWFFRVARSWRTLHMRFCNNELTNLEEDMWLPIPERNCECMEWECCFLSQTVSSGNDTTEVSGNLELLRKLLPLASAAV